MQYSPRTSKAKAVDHAGARISGRRPRWVLAAVAALLLAIAGPSLVSAQGADGVCRPGLVVSSEESCTYPGASAEFSIDSSGRGHFLAFTSGRSIELSETTVDGVVYDFAASAQGGGTWLVETAGDPGAPTTTRTPGTPSTPAPTPPGGSLDTAGDSAVEGRIEARRLSSGAVEFGFRPEGEALILPDQRFFSATARVDRWLVSSDVVSAGEVLGRITARRLADGRIEFGFNSPAGERVLPRGRFFPTTAPVDRWLRSTIIDVPLSKAAPESAPEPESTPAAESTPAPGQTSVETDREALVALYHATGGAGWTNNANWLSDEPLGRWFGVFTDANGRVVRLELSLNELSGELPAELGQLSELRWLRMSYNQLSGPIPAELGRLGNLATLRLTRSQLSGAIPAELGQLASLEALYLNFNDLGGAIPAALGRLQSLVELDLSWNELSGEIPAELGQLSALEGLDVSDNDLSGEIPATLGQLSSLEGLDLSDNDLDGPIPPALGRLSNLAELHLSNNNLSGQIPAALGQLSNLGLLYLFGNDLSGEIPPELGQIPELRYLYLARNALSGCIPESLSDVQWNDFSRTGLPSCGAVPDLVVDTPTVSESTPAAGARFRLNATVRNQGMGRADSTRLHYYQSDDPAVTAGDTEVGNDFVLRLEPSASGDEWVTLTAPSTAGTYYYGACVEAVPGEFDTTNNCSAAITVTVGAAPAPDLVVDTPTVSESAPAAGARFTLRATVRNQGTGRADSTTLRYYRSTDAAVTSGDTEVGDDYVSRLEASASGDEWVSLKAPSTAGTYYYAACVDAVSDEQDTTNNCSAAVAIAVGAAPAPDLVVDAPTVSESAPAAGARFTLRATVRNQGTGRADSTTLRYYRSTDAAVTSADTEVGDDYVSRLAASASGDEWVTLTAPATAGTYYYRACVEAVPGEFDTTNNCSAAVAIEVGAAPAPDLVVDTPTVSESAPATGARFTLRATVRNQGTGRADSTRLRYYRSTDAAVTSADTEVGDDYVSRLAASASGDEWVTLTAPATAGTYYYGACVDEVSDEKDTSNNCSAAVAIEVGAAPAPDLVVDTPTVSESAPAAGARFTLRATVRNQGTGRADSSTLRYYRSTDAVITTGDTAAGTDSVSALSASRTGAEYTSVTAPSAAGTYYYGACVDAVSDEKDTSNNCSAAVAITVGSSPTFPDPPTGLTATAKGQTGIDLSWTAPESDGGAAITGYRIEVSTDGSSWNVLAADTGSTATTYSHTGLTAGSTRHYRAFASNSVGRSLTSTTASTTTTTSASPTAPGTPTGLTATANGQTRIDLSWTAPSDNGGAAITGYKIEVSTDNSSWSDLSANTKSSSTSYSHTGLTAESVRYYRVSAINSAGTGSASSAANATTDERLASDGDCSVGLTVAPGESCTYPGTSTEFSVDANGTGRFLLTSSGTSFVLRNTTINGVSYTLVASKQPDGNWRIDEVG